MSTGFLFVSLVSFYGNVLGWGVIYTESQPRSLSCIKGKPEVEVVFAFTFLFKWLPSQIHPVPLIKQGSCFPYSVQDDKASPSPKQSL